MVYPTVVQRLYVPLTADARAALVRLARDERRHPSDQAAYIIERALTDRSREEGRRDAE
ncbi:MAG: hypothetical protein AB7R89_16270 [Dehalococcoidia bacterium]